jgi:DNA-binding response OmpR family regulator
MNSKAQSTILLVGDDPSLNYLLGRFAERSGYQLTHGLEGLSIAEISAVDPAVIIFLSAELLGKTPSLFGELASLDAPIIVCSSVAEESRAREWGADYCLLHPLTYDEFRIALKQLGISKRT